MQRLEVNGAVRLTYRSLGVKGLSTTLFTTNPTDWLRLDAGPPRQTAWDMTGLNSMSIRENNRLNSVATWNSVYRVSERRGRM